MLTSAQLASELQTDPLALGYAAKIGANDWQGCADLLNAQNYTQVVSTFINARKLMSVMGPTAGAAVLDALNAAAASNSAVKWAMAFITSDTGIDMGDPATRGEVSALQTNGVLTAAQGSALLNIASVPASRAQVLWGAGTIVAENDVINAHYGRA